MERVMGLAVEGLEVLRAFMRVLGGGGAKSKLQLLSILAALLVWLSVEVEMVLLLAPPASSHSDFCPEFRDFAPPNKLNVI